MRASLRGIVWVGVGQFVFGLVSLVWPPLILPAAGPGVSPGGKADNLVIMLEASSAGPGGKMPPSTAGKMPAANWWRGRDAPSRSWPSKRYPPNDTCRTPEVGRNSLPVISYPLYPMHCFC